MPLFEGDKGEDEERVVGTPAHARQKDVLLLLLLPARPCNCQLLCDLGQASVRSAVSSMTLFEPFSLLLLLLKMQM